ncbi:hypothetical protein [Rhodopseudomonas sp.]
MRSGGLRFANPPYGLSLSFKGLGEDETLATAKGFDWKAMRAALK